MTTSQLHVFTPRGNRAVFRVRPDTNDANLIFSLVGTPTELAVDEYKLRERYLSGWALDVGSHIGSVAIALAIDNPDLRILAMECVPDNLELLEVNIRDNGLLDRVIIETDAATRPGVEWIQMHFGYRRWGNHNPAYVEAHRFIGNQYRGQGEPTESLTLPGVDLGTVLERHEIDDVSFMKIDCEGCEWDFLDSPAVRFTDTIMGELHCGFEYEEYDPAWKKIEEPGCHRCPNTEDHIRRLLEPTHHVDVDRPRELFEAKRR